MKVWAYKNYKLLPNYPQENAKEKIPYITQTVLILKGKIYIVKVII